ncbi:MAG: NfeD family protein [Thermoplasmata archaeon]|nr:MAG: NfeD family protein [Thermoplasmata archaeon]RLF71761.1 MAG: NfeD family protein [Thermoplasmata archaeon]RLF75302.1 MAG: NfeD family protein [Thermoplasmata archaeon]
MGIDMLPKKGFGFFPLILSIWVMATNNTTSSGSFDPHYVSIILLVLGLILVAVEASTPGYFIIIPGTIFIILGVFGLIAPAMFLSLYTPIIVIVALLASTAFTIKFYQIIAGKPEPTITPTTNSMIGKEGIVIKETDPDDPTKGRVRVSGEDWAATSDEPLPPGTKVVVVGGEGVHLRVKKK